MATYEELNEIVTNSATNAQKLREKVRRACDIAAQKILVSADTASPPFNQNAGFHDQRVKWAEKVLAESERVYEQMFRMVIAANEGVPQTSITGAGDSAIQTNIEELIDALSANLV